MKLVAFVPMRHDSVRVKQKNYRPIAGKPLFHYILDTLLAVPEISQVAVDTDSPVIMEGLAREYPDVVAIPRPAHLTADTVPMNTILLHDTAQLPADLYLQTHSTNPLMRPETFSRAIKTYLEKQDAYDSLFGVSRWQSRFWDSSGKPVNHNPAELLRTQDLPPLFEDNSCVYIFTREGLAKHNNRLGERRPS